MLAGRYRPDDGTIEVDGQSVVFASSKDAIKAGIGMVYQHFMLVESMTVAENVLLALLPASELLFPFLLLGQFFLALLVTELVPSH